MAVSEGGTGICKSADLLLKYCAAERWAKDGVGTIILWKKRKRPNSWRKWL